MPRTDNLSQEFTVEAETLIRGIYAIAGRSRASRGLWGSAAREDDE